MSGIIVGVDGSGLSQRALAWAMHEAAIRHVPLTVLTVHEAVRGYYSGMATYPDDPARTEDARVAAGPGRIRCWPGWTAPARSRSWSRRSMVEELINAGKDADMIVLGSRGAGGFTRLMMGSVVGQVAQHALCPVLIVPPENRG